jgi:hypothetical protein
LLLLLLLPDVHLELQLLSLKLMSNPILTLHFPFWNQKLLLLKVM